MDGSDISETRTISVRGFTKAVPVSSVNVTAPYTTLTPETRMVALSAEVLPMNATDRSVTWSVVSGSAIVSVDYDGYVSAKGYNGTATVRATANDGSGVYGEITLTVTGFTGEIVPVESVRIIAPYTELTPEQRRDNVAGAFALRGAGRLEGRHALIVDDVVTTGATIAACAAAMAAVPGARLSVLTLGAAI